MPETNTPAERNRLQIGIALAGGGPLGGIYEVGALMALDEALRGFRLTDSGVFVGVSSGAFFASGLANGLSPRAMHRMFIESDKDDDPFEPEVLLKPAFGEYGRRIAAIPRLLTSGLADYLRGGHNRKAAASLRRLVQALPAGLFDSAPLQAYLRRLASSRGFPDDFRKLRRKLYIVATDLDSSELVTFGSPGWDDVPISSAVQASAALPGLFPPVKINGRYYVDGALQRTLNASVALKDGVKLLFAFNPIVPYKADPPAGRDGTESLANGGLLGGPVANVPLAHSLPHEGWDGALPAYLSRRGYRPHRTAPGRRGNVFRQCIQLCGPAPAVRARLPADARGPASQGRGSQAHPGAAWLDPRRGRVERPKAHAPATGGGKRFKPSIRFANAYRNLGPA